jgi:hypothetical protein
VGKCVLVSVFLKTHAHPPSDTLIPNVQLQEVKLKLVKGAESKSATDLPRTRRPPPQCAAPRGQAKAGQRRRDEICYRSSSHKLQEVRLKLVNGAESNLLQIFLAQAPRGQAKAGQRSRVESATDLPRTRYVTWAPRPVVDNRIHPHE